MQGLAMPILSSSECLRVLSRMSMPRLEHLELVYEADGLEEDLLVHVASMYPHLQSFELHQYRSASHGSVALRFDRVSEILSLVKTLRAVYLNLDYKHEDNMMFDPDICDCEYEHDQDCLRWPSSTVLERYGSALLTGMERLGRCPVLEGLYLLYFDEEYDDGQHRWVRFLPSRYPGTAAERVDWDEDEQRLDSPPPYDPPMPTRRIVKHND
ncbi:hypothetical protein C8T65DRAFT_793856 [Cerioporus squamosus]|nr:hypothetical protein C8T65DRAFT_793856 [Cerioporus squamosus]